MNFFTLNTIFSMSAVAPIQEHSEEAEDGSAEQVAENSARDARRERIREIANTAFSYFQTHILTNVSFLKELQKRKKLFTLNENVRGTWFVIFTPETALRFKQAIDERMPRYLLSTSLKHEDQKETAPGKKVIFDWKTVFFLSAERIGNYSQALQIVKSLADDDDDDTAAAAAKEGDEAPPKKPLNAEQERMLDKLNGNYPMLNCMTNAQFNQMCASIEEYTPSTQLVVTLMFVFKERRIVASQSIFVDLSVIMRNPHSHLKNLAIQHYFESAVTSSALLHDEEITDEHLNLIRYLPYSYALSSMKLSGIVDHNSGLPSDPSKMRQAIHSAKAQCAYCYKVGASKRCPSCHLFAYCNETCRINHYRSGSLLSDDEGSSVENAVERRVASTPHSVHCAMVRTVVRMWGQIPPTMSMEEFNELANEADEVVRKSFEESVEEEEEEEKKE